MQTALTEMLGIKYPLIMAPMFLVSNEEMIIEGLHKGVTGAFPALNYRTLDELRSAIQTIKSAEKGPFGVNLIVNKSNVKLEGQLQVCVEEKVGFIITSLGSPKNVIEKCSPLALKFFVMWWIWNMPRRWKIWEPML